MPAGLQVFDQFGQLKIDISTRIPRFLGTYFVGTGGGTIVNAGLLTGEPQCFCVMNAPGGSTWPANNLLPPPISISGDTLTYGACNAPHRLQLWVF